VTDEGALFDVGTAAAATRPGLAEASLRRSLAVGFEEGRLVHDVDQPLAESALILARALDTADRIGGLKGGYLAAQAQPALQKALHALRLPTELTAATPPAPAPDSQTTAPEWLRDAFGTPE
jgi:hypothetical protein